jgi:FlaA1/EpsC-like NDP-sugar epimerase
MKTTRRSFLSTSTLASAFALTPSFVRAASSANGDLRICVIGFHSRGKGLANDVLKSKGAKLVALCDVDSEVLDGFASELEKKGVKVAKFEDYRKVCESKDIDAVIIATPNHLHTLIATTAAANGKHAYVEKPVSHNVWEGRQLANAAEKYKTIIQHGFQRRSETHGTKPQIISNPEKSARQPSSEASATSHVNPSEKSAQPPSHRNL